MRPLVSIIVPVYNQWDQIPDLLRCIERQSYQNFELIVVDNGSLEVPDLSNEAQSFQLAYCDTPGSYAARNCGIEAAQGEYFAFTDSDCRPSPSWLSSAVQRQLEEGNALAMVAGAVEITPRDPASPNLFELYDRELGIPQAAYVKDGHAATANLLVPAGVFTKLGGFDSGRFSGGDTEFSKRATESGFPLVYCAEASVSHGARASLEELTAKVRRIKGGQLFGGSRWNRMIGSIRALLPPVRAWRRIVRRPNLRMTQKVALVLLQSRLWGTEVAEVSRLVIFRQAPQR